MTAVEQVGWFVVCAGALVVGAGWTLIVVAVGAALMMVGGFVVWPRGTRALLDSEEVP